MFVLSRGSACAGQRLCVSWEEVVPVLGRAGAGLESRAYQVP